MNESSKIRTFTDDEYRILKELIFNKKQDENNLSAILHSKLQVKHHNEDRIRNLPPIVETLDYVPDRVIVGGLYNTQFTPGGLYVYEDRVIVGKYPGVPSGYIWSCSMKEQIPNEKVAMMINNWLSIYKKK